MITDDQLRQIMPKLAPAKRKLYLPHLNRAMQAYGVQTLLRIAAFVAQLAHESGEFRWMEELWGPTPAQRRYEPPGALAKRLGNVQSGDGKRFKGRGPIQITGRFNYRRFGELLGIDLSADPTLAARPEIAFATAGMFWRTNGLNELADADQFVAITRRINGGIHGLAERLRYYERAKAVLAAPIAVRGGPGAPLLLRGHEAIAAESGRKPPGKRAPTRPAATTEAPVESKSAAARTVAKKAVAKRTTANRTTAKRAAAGRAGMDNPPGTGTP